MPIGKDGKNLILLAGVQLPSPDISNDSVVIHQQHGGRPADA